MHSEIIGRIVEKLDTDILEKKGDFVVFKNDKYKPVKLDMANFRQINDIASSKKIAFIDGGNSELIGSNNFSLQFVRIAYVVYQNNKRVSQTKKEFYVLAFAKEENGNIFYEIETFGSDIKFSKIDSFDKTMKTGDHRISVSRVGDICRKFAEIKYCGDIIEELSAGDMIVKDGHLECSITNETDYMDSLYNRASAKGIIICGLAKTSNLLTNTGNSAAAVLNTMNPDKDWHYYPVVEITDANHKAELSFVKLHPGSKYVFRFEIFNKQGSATDEVLALLKQNSIDPIFLGYPYGLIEADRLGRVSNNDMEYLKTSFMAKAGKRFEKIRRYMAAVDSHSILDSVS
jgi:hypothetical protein